jgi:serine/threonine-protein kinase
MTFDEHAGLNPDRWKRIEEVFHLARERASVDQRAFLDTACAGDAALRAHVEALLKQADGPLMRDGLVPLVQQLVSSPSGRLQGRRLGPYELGALVGAGGMSEVYRSRDTKLGRDVAIKILPETLAASADRLARFEREARILAALNHPNIAVIHGVVEGEGLHGLILELVEGPTLEDKLAAQPNRAPLPIVEALGLARQIAEALEAAHRKGVIHRDLKPANIKITPAGIVKVLDFGIAKIEATDDAPVHTLHATIQGAVLGTVAYMSPEQARGLPVDKRTDMWAFGCVLYEMLSGCRSFPGDTFADVMGAITTAEPDWSRLPADTPPRVRDVLRRCLTKDPARRLHDIADGRIEIADVLDGRVEPQRANLRGGNRTRRRLLVAGAVLVAVVGVAAGTSFLWSRTTRTARPTRVSIELPPDLSVYAIGRGSSVVVSPDGQRIVYVAAIGDSTRLYMRSLEGFESTPIAGTDGATNPFFSPDGKWIGFWIDVPNNGFIRKVPVAGGPVTTVAEHAAFLGGAWGADDSILYGTLGRISRVPPTGAAQLITVPTEGAMFHAWPAFLPDGSGFTYTLWNNKGFEGGRIVTQSGFDRDAKPTVLVEGGSYGRVVSFDRRSYLIYAKPEGLFAAPYDVSAQRLIGQSVLVEPDVLVNLSGGANFSFSPTGVLAYVTGGLAEAKKTLLWLDRDGKIEEARTIAGIGFQYSLSPDGTRIVRPNATGQNRDLWIDYLDGRRSSIKITRDEITNSPTWTPDGRRVIYTSGQPHGNLFWRAADGAGDEERLTTSPNFQTAGSVTPDGKTLLYFELDSQGDASLWMLPLTGAHQPKLFLNTPSNEGFPAISPDGRWVAYSSNISGRVESYIASFPDAGHRTPVSHGGGYVPAWSPNGRELFFRSARPETGTGQMMVATVDTTGAEPKIGEPRVLFASPVQSGGSIDANGRFLVIRGTPREASARVIQLVLNWFGDLQAKVSSP